MGRSKISVVISFCSLLVAAGSVATLYSMRNAASKGTHVRAVTFEESGAGSQTPLPIDPAAITYRQSTHFSVEPKKATAIAVDPDDHIYVAGEKSLYRYSRDGQFQRRIALTDTPTCLAIGGRQHISPGQIYVGFADHVEVFDPDGIKVGIWLGLGEKARFTSISASEHDIFIADAGANLVQHFDATGKLLSPLGESSPGHLAPAGNSSHFDLVVGRDGLVYVVDRRDCRVEGWTFSGDIESHWGQASPSMDDFAGHNNPSQIALTSGGQFVTAEEEPLRIKVYTRDGAIAGVVCGPEDTSSVTDLAADYHNRILVLDGAAGCVRVFEEKKAAKKE